jgi:tRNA 2-thiocytidine biosynthesis protein TtcA
VIKLQELERLETKLMHYTKKALSVFNMIETGDRVLVCLSGGKDSYTMLSLLHKLQIRSKRKFYIQALTLDQRQPGWDDTAMRAYLASTGIDFEIISEDTYSIVVDKIPENKTYCSLCSRLRRGIIYTYAEKNNFNKIALGHHRDDLIETLFMSIMYNGEIKSMPPKLLSDNKKHVVIRPLAYCQEKDIDKYSLLKKYPIIPCNLCGAQENLSRMRIKRLIKDLALENPKIPSNILHALSSVKPSQLMDTNLWDFVNLSSEESKTREKLELELDDEAAIELEEAM